MPLRGTNSTNVTTNNSHVRVVLYAIVSIVITFGLSLWENQAGTIILIFVTGLSTVILTLVLIPRFKHSMKHLPTAMLVLFLLAIGPNVLSFASVILNDIASDYLLLNSMNQFTDSLSGTGRLIALIILACLLVIQIGITARISPRTSEVVARFSLDSLPGRQMAIEVRESSGSILPEEAEMQLSDLQRTCDYFGAMNGVNRVISHYIRFYSAGLLSAIILRILGLVEGIPQLIHADSLLIVQTGVVNLLPAFILSISIIFASVGSYSTGRES